MQAKRVVILGAGISGLALGWLLKKKWQDAIDLKILEKSARAGGWIRSQEINGFLFEQGPRSFVSRGNGAYTLQLIEELGLTNEIIEADPAAKIRFLYIKGRLIALPHKPWQWLKSPLTPTLVGALLRDLLMPAGGLKEESIYDFACRRFGRKAAELFIDPLVTGIYAGDPRQLSLQACFPSLHAWEKEYRSIVVGAFRSDSKPNRLFTFRNGVETLTKALACRLQGQIHFENGVTTIQNSQEGMQVRCENGAVYYADQVFSTLPAGFLGKVLNLPALENMVTESLQVVNVGFRNLKLPYKGYGYLIPSNQRQKILGMVWDSQVFPQQNRHPDETRLTIMLRQGGVQTALESLREHLGIVQEPDVVHLTLAKDAIPQYTIGHQARLSILQQEGLHILGSSFHGVSVNDCISEAYKACNLHKDTKIAL